MGQRPLRLLRQTDHRRQGSVRAQFDQPAQRHLGESRLETAAGRLAQVAEQLRGVAHAGLTAVDRHQTPASIKGRGVFLQAWPAGAVPPARWPRIRPRRRRRAAGSGRCRKPSRRSTVARGPPACRRRTGRERPDFAPTAGRSTWVSGREVWDRAGARAVTRSGVASRHWKHWTKVPTDPVKVLAQGCIPSVMGYCAQKYKP